VAILAVDTLGERLGLGLEEGGRVWRTLRRPPSGHDRLLGPALDALLSRSGLALDRLEAVAAARGPGRFTGVRVGLAFSTVLAQALGCPALGLTGLETLAFEAAPEAPEGTVLLTLADAGKDEVFWQAFRCHAGGPAPAARRAAEPEPLGPPGWSPLHEVRRPPGNGPIILTGGPAPRTLEAAPEVKGATILRPCPPSIEGLLALARARLSRLGLKGPVLHDAAPLYLKAAKFELAKGRRGA